MKILLVKPYNLSDHIQPSLGLVYLATVARYGNEVKILDCLKENVKINQLGKIVKSYKPNLVGFQYYTFDTKFIREALGVIKNISKDIITVTGGPHPSALPEETMKCFKGILDFAFVGESERGFKSLLEYLSGNGVDILGIPGLAWREDGIVKVNTPFFEENLDSIGMAAWDLIRPETYPESQHGAFYKKFPIAPIILTRGCPYECTFCAGKVVSGKKFRKRSVSNVINEIKTLYTDYGIREFHIVDDNFTLDKAHAKHFFKELLNLGLDISLATPNGISVDNLDEELLILMKKSGVYLISLGIESGSDRILRLMKKNLEVERIKKTVSLIRNLGFEVAGFFILGFPTEKKEDIRNTIRLSLELDLLRANFFTYLPFPGTESHYDLAKNGELNGVDWEKFYFMNAAYAPKGITRRELKRLQRLAFFKFYFRPRILWKNILGIKSLKHFCYLLKRFYHWIIMS